MADTRSSLLGFAVAASVAVVPMLVGVLMAIGAVFPSDRQSAATDVHVSVRQLAAMKTFESGIVRRDAVAARALDADALLGAIPECAQEWSARGRFIDRVRAVVRPMSGAPVARRVAAELAELDAALARMSAEANRRVVDPVGFDLGRWSLAARAALAQPVESPQYPGRSFRVACDDLAAAAAALARGHGRMLSTLAWRGSEVDRTTATWRPGQYVAISAHHVARANPWAGVPGCVFLAGGDEPPAVPPVVVRGTRTPGDRVCLHPPVYAATIDEAVTARPTAVAGEPRAFDPPGDARWQVPPSLGALLQPLDTLLRPSGALYRSQANATVRASGPASDAPAVNRVALDGADVDVGYSVDLTIDPVLQALAQRIAACYTGRQDVCSALGVRRAEDRDGVIGRRLLERAMVRMAAIAIVDVPSGRIEALAGALSPCARQEVDGPGRDMQCDARIPYPIRYRPDALLNPAVYHDAMPASTVKPILAASFLSNATVGARWLAAERSAMRNAAPPAQHSLRGQLMRSDSARFLDRMFCADQAFRPCERVWEVEAKSVAFGWNAGCASPSERCGRHDLLFARPAGASVDDGDARVAQWIPFGRLLVVPDERSSAGRFVDRSPIALDAARVKRCAAGRDGRPGSRDDWEKCSGGVVVDVVAEGWGQGHARSTALGAAGMMATLAAAANGDSERHAPHLVRGVRGVAGESRPAIEAEVARWSEAGIEPLRVSAEAAEVILSGLSFSHRSGTARLACEQVFDARTCRDIDWIAGKTGTPTFPNDDRSLDELARLCAPGARRTAADELACSSLRPYKWYVAAYRSDPRSARWTKAIGVLTERNWLADGGRIHGAGDHGPNPAAEIALQVAGRHVGALEAALR